MKSGVLARIGGGTILLQYTLISKATTRFKMRFNSKVNETCLQHAPYRGKRFAMRSLASATREIRMPFQGISIEAARAAIRDIPEANLICQQRR